jgi:hypothetical protein
MFMFQRFYKYANEKLDKFGAYLSFRNYSAEGRAGKLPLRGALALSSYRTSDSIRIEWHFGVMGMRAFVKSEPDESVFRTGFAIPGFSIYSSVQSYSVLGKATKQVGHREVRIAVHDGAIWWTSPFVDPDMMKSDEPWYLRGSFSFSDALLGKVETKRESISVNEPVVIPMPEGCYPATVSFDLVTFGRSRWFQTTTKMADIKLDKGDVPYPGKGENAWDCGTDGTRQLSTPASSPAEAVGIFVGHVLQKRWARGGKSWLPDPSSGPSSDDAPNIPSDTIPPSGVYTASTIASEASPVLN